MYNVYTTLHSTYWHRTEYKVYTYTALAQNGVQSVHLHCTGTERSTKCTLTLHRCSGLGEIAADALSKGNWDTAWAAMPLKHDDPGRIPASLLCWINDPTPDTELGSKILSDMMKYTKVVHLM